jgi:hypothetical protein
LESVVVIEAQIRHGKISITGSCPGPVTGISQHREIAACTVASRFPSSIKVNSSLKGGAASGGGVIVVVQTPVKLCNLSAPLVWVPLRAQAPNPVGEWNLQSDAQGQITKFTLTISKDGDTFKGKVASEQYGAQDLKDLKVENGTVTYTRNLEIAGQAVAMSFKGQIEGDKLTVAYTVQGIELPVTGSRKK